MYINQFACSLQVCGSSYLRYPDLDLKKLAALDTVDMDVAVNTELKVHFGKSCNADQKVSSPLRL